MKKPLRRSAAMLCLVLLMGLTAPAVYAEDFAPEISVEDITGWEETPTQEFFPISVEVTEENGLKLLRKTFVVDREVSPSVLIETEVSRLGCAYTYLETLKEELPGAVETKTVTKSITIVSDSNDLAAIAAAQEAVLPYDEGGFSGELTLDEGKIAVWEGAKESYSYAVTDTRTYSGLAAQDPYLVPKEVSKNGVTLSLSDIAWTGEGVQPDGSGLPASYTAAASYSGRGYGAKTVGYQAALPYSGEVSRITPGQVKYTLVYEEIQLEPLMDIIPDEPAEPSKRPLLPFWLMTSGVTLLAAAGGILIGRKGGRKVE